MDINFDVSKLFTRNYKSKAKVIVNRGGTRSGKTMNIMACALVWLLNRDEGTVWSVCRRTLPALKASAYRDFLFLLDRLPDQVRERINHNKTELIFTFGNKTVEFFSLDDEAKVRSRKRDILHLVEANENEFEMFVQLSIRTTKRIYVDFNPDDVDSWINVELEQKRATEKKDVEVIVSTYKDNPFLTEIERQEIEYLKSVNSELWAVFGEGQYGRMQGRIFNKFTIHDEDIKYEYGGLDFGFTFDPTAATLNTKINNRLYTKEVLYERGLTNRDIYLRLKDYNVLWVADSAEPKSIEELSRYGLRIIPAVKGPDSVRAGLMQMLDFDWYIHSVSTNQLKEVRNYKWDPHEPNKPIDAFNHAIDSTRYVVQTKMKTNSSLGHAQKINAYKNFIVR